MPICTVQLAIVEVAAVTFVVLGHLVPLARSSDEPLVNLAVTFPRHRLGRLAARPSRGSCSPRRRIRTRHGVALIGCTIALVVANDIGAYLVGSKFGRRHLAAKISPGKTVEGLIGGTLLSLVVAGWPSSRDHPLHRSARALVLGGRRRGPRALSATCSSPRVKRDLGVKDMSNLLPSHGGLFDRIDATLFVLPAAFLLITIAKLH